MLRLPATFLLPSGPLLHLIHAQYLMGWSLDAATGAAFEALAAGAIGLLAVLGFAAALALAFVAADEMARLGFGGAATSSFRGGR